MSAPRTTRRPAAWTAAITATVSAAAVVLLGLTGPAAADPRGVDVDPCADTLSQVTRWPGTSGDGSTHYSDAYQSYLLSQGVCTLAR